MCNINTHTNMRKENLFTCVIMFVKTSETKKSGRVEGRLSIWTTIPQTQNSTGWGKKSQ